LKSVSELRYLAANVRNCGEPQGGARPTCDPRLRIGQKRIPADLATQVANHVADDTLTLREIEVLRAIAAGNANKLIADKLSITEETVKGHVKNILSKLGANDRTHAVTIGLKRGIIEL